MQADGSSLDTVSGAKVQVLAMNGRHPCPEGFSLVDCGAGTDDDYQG